MTRLVLSVLSIFALIPGVGCRARTVGERIPDGGLKTLTLEELGAIGRRGGIERARPEPRRTPDPVAPETDGGAPELNFNYRMLPAVISDDGCGPTSKRCTLFGLCAGGDGGCAAVSEADCRRSVFCRAAGRCGLQGGACVATGDADCRASNGCRYRGDCSHRGSECVAKFPADCLNSLWCLKSGFCTPRAERCVAAARSDCLASSRCREVGACSERDGMCVVASEDDCRMSVVCRNLEKCRFDAKDKGCVK